MDHNDFMKRIINKERMKMKKLVYKIREILVGWGWHYFGSTCLIGFFAFTNLREGYPLLLFPLSGALVLVIGYALPKQPKLCESSETDV